MKLKSMNHVLSVIKRCDVIIKNGQEQFVGLYYDRVRFDRPIVLFKCDWGLNYYLSKALELMPVPCVEQKLLARALFNNTKEGDFIDTIYFSEVASIYRNLPAFSDEKEDFDEELNNDVLLQLYQLEKDICKRAENKFWKQQIKNQIVKHIKIQIDAVSDDNVREELQKSISELAARYEMDYRIIHNASQSTDEYYLESEVEEHNFDLWIMVMLSIKDQKIYVGNRTIFQSFEMKNVDLACEYIKTLAETTCTELVQKTNQYCDEFKINPRLYDIAENTLKTMLKMNYNWNGIEYGFYGSNKTAFMTYLRDQDDPSRMYEICITYNELLRNPDAFKQLIENPKVVRKWNFWSRRKKYKKELFDEKFQTIEQ